MPSTLSKNPRRIQTTIPMHHLTINLSNDSSLHPPISLPIPNIQHSKTCLLPPHDLSPVSIVRTHAAPYLKRNESTALPTNSACITAMEITQFRTACIFNTLPKRVTPNNAPTFMLYLHPLPPLLSLYLPLLLLSFPPLKTPRLRAPSDRITEGYYLGYFANFVA